VKAILMAIGAVFLLVVVYLGYRYWELQQMAAKYANPMDIASESIQKDGSTWTIHFESVLGEPIDKVWKAMHQPERSHEFMEAFRRSELKKTEGNTKTVEFDVQVLTLPIQTFVAELTFDDANHQMSLKTLSGPQDQTATYRLQALDPNKTLLVYDATAVDRVSVPLPQGVQQSALRELFVNQIRAIQKSIAADEGKSKAAA
jgi:hypothetical protein